MCHSYILQNGKTEIKNYTNNDYEIYYQINKKKIQIIKYKLKSKCWFLDLLF